MMPVKHYGLGWADGFRKLSIEKDSKTNLSLPSLASYKLRIAWLPPSNFS